MKISRILTLIIIAALVFVIASCGAETVDTDVPTTNENPTESTETTSTAATESTETTSTAATEPAETEPDEPRVEKFDIYYNEEMNVGETQKITFDVVLSGQWPDIIEETPFKSSDESILVIDKDGNATALSTGTVTVTVSHQTAQKSVEITVCGFAPRPDDPYVKKPVIYLYPTEQTDITLTFENDENLLTTYPKYNGAWSVHAYPDGTLTDENGRQYYALFFDEARTYYVDFSSGFYKSLPCSVSPSARRTSL